MIRKRSGVFRRGLAPAHLTFTPFCVIRPAADGLPNYWPYGSICALKFSFFTIMGNFKLKSLLTLWLMCKINCKFVDFINVTSGLQQGSVLGPFLFIVVSNNVIYKEHFCDVHLYFNNCITPMGNL